MSEITSPSVKTQPRNRAWNVVLWILQAVAAAGFVLAAAGKLTSDPQVMATFHTIGLGPWFRYLLATLEMLGAAALLIPRLIGLAALAFVALMVGAVLTQVATGGGLAMALFMFVLSMLIAWGRRHSTRQLWADVRRRQTRRHPVSG